MSSEILWLPKTPATLMTSELNGFPDEGVVVDAADYDNATNKFRWAAFQLLANSFAVGAPGVGAFVELHIFYNLGGKHCDGEHGDAASPVPSGNSRHGTFHIDATQGIQYQQVLGVPLLPHPLRLCLVNKTGRDFAASGNFLKMFPYSEEAQ